jgi:hypothetical protein
VDRRARSGARARAPARRGCDSVEISADVAQPPASPLRRCELGRQLIAAHVFETLVLLGVDRVGLRENLARDLLVIARRLHRRVGRHLRAIDRDDPDPNQASLRAQRQPLAEQLGQRRRVALAKARDRRVIKGPGWHRSPAWQHPQRNAARSVVRSARRSRRRRATAQPSSPDRAPPGHARPRDRRQRTRSKSNCATASITNHARCPSGSHSRRLSGWDHRGSAGVDGVDDLGVVDARQMDRSDAQVGVAELALDDDRRDALAGHLDGVRVAELMRCQASADTGPWRRPGGVQRVRRPLTKQFSPARRRAARRVRRSGLRVRGRSRGGTCSRSRRSPRPFPSRPLGRGRRRHARRRP